LRDETALNYGGPPLSSLTNWRDTLEVFLLITTANFVMTTLFSTAYEG
jgi:hypothetical protein